MPRHNLDQYETAPWQVDALVDHLPELQGKTVWCPCVGDGALIRQLRIRVPSIRVTMTNDLDPAVAAMHHDDATQPDVWTKWQQEHGYPEWVVDNPPFNVAIKVLKLAEERAVCGVVFLSRVSFVEATKDRGPWLAAHPRHLQVVLERYSFTGDGHSDMATCEWLVWSKMPLVNTGGFTAYGYKKGI